MDLPCPSVGEKDVSSPNIRIAAMHDLADGSPTSAEQLVLSMNRCAGSISRKEAGERYDITPSRENATRARTGVPVILLSTHEAGRRPRGGTMAAGQKARRATGNTATERRRSLLFRVENRGLSALRTSPSTTLRVLCTILSSCTMVPWRVEPGPAAKAMRSRACL
jgi:hypothetical protein